MASFFMFQFLQISFAHVHGIIYRVNTHHSSLVRNATLMRLTIINVSVAVRFLPVRSGFPTYSLSLDDDIINPFLASSAIN